MSRSDFEACTPSEFSAVASKWGTWREGIERAEWERMRTHASMVLNLFSRRRLRPGDVLRFPWDGSGGEGKTPESTPERMREMVRRFASAAAAPSEDRVEAYKGRNDQGAAQDSADNPDGIQEEKFPKAI